MKTEEAGWKKGQGGRRGRVEEERKALNFLCGDYCSKKQNNALPKSQTVLQSIISGESDKEREYANIA